MKILAALALGLLLAGASPAAYDVGPPVGAHVPTFSARDATGAPRTLAGIMGPKGVVLVFFRSSKWCPFCQLQLISLRDAAASLAQRGYRLAAISYQPPEELADFTRRRAINYILLSDAGSKTIDAFHLRDPQYPPGSFAYGVPQPSIFIIAPNGVIRAKLAYQGFKVRPDNPAILAAVDGPRH
ncbi:MAG TPA: peroxiredoxin family protein [Caulobacteraceae bacterium]|jgi:peroxiredoxin|nr:peroxiredoxin family protein [Caulobacteraceae bacterium]